MQWFPWQTHLSLFFCAVPSEAWRLWASNIDFRLYPCPKTLIESIGWSSVIPRRKMHMLLFIAKTIFAYIMFLCSLLSHHTSNCDTTPVHLDPNGAGEMAFLVFISCAWNNLQNTISPQTTLSLHTFKGISKTERKKWNVVFSWYDLDINVSFTAAVFVVLRTETFYFFVYWFMTPSWPGRGDVFVSKAFFVEIK